MIYRHRIPMTAAILLLVLVLAMPAGADYKVWRKADGTVVGYCEATYSGFKPGGDVKSYTVTIEPKPPAMPPPPPSKADVLKAKIDAVLADPAASQSVKAAMSALKATLP